MNRVIEWGIVDMNDDHDFRNIWEVDRYPDSPTIIVYVIVAFSLLFLAGVGALGYALGSYLSCS